MTTEQHLELARKAGQIARSNNWRAVSDHPFDNDQDECAEDAVLWAAGAWHHALLAQRCGKCKGSGRIGTPSWKSGWERCADCNAAGWIARAT